MRKKSLPIGVLVMVFVVLLAAIGISYGYWTETLDAQADVTTGQLDVNWESPSAQKGGAPGNATCAVTIPGGHDKDLLHIDMLNLYPGVECKLSAYIRNTGNVPVEISVDTQPQITGDTVIDQYLDTLEEIHCASNEIAPGGAVYCTGTIGMFDHWTGDQGENLSASYVFEVTATQKGD